MKNVYALVIFAGLINWRVTSILVEATLFDRPRNWIIARAQHANIPNVGIVKMPYTFPEGTTPEEAAAATVVFAGKWLKPAQLVTCFSCLGVWVALAEALVFGGPFAGWYAIVANTLLYTAIGHLVLELRSRVAKV